MQTSTGVLGREKKKALILKKKKRKDSINREIKLPVKLSAEKGEGEK